MADKPKPTTSEYSDSRTVGHYDERRMFEETRGRPGPRGPKKAGAGGEHIGPEQSQAYIRKAAPLS